MRGDSVLYHILDIQVITISLCNFTEYDYHLKRLPFVECYRGRTTIQYFASSTKMADPLKISVTIGLVFKVTMSFKTYSIRG